MAVAKISSFKSSTLLRHGCFFGLGFQASLMLRDRTFSIESIAFLIVYALGVYVSKQTDKRMILGFAAISVILSLERALFYIKGFSPAKQNTTATTQVKGQSSTSSFAFTGFNVDFVDGAQVVLSLILGYISFTIYQAK
jgi:uncharacterized protein YebE (UPF0316 family)